MTYSQCLPNDSITNCQCFPNDSLGVEYIVDDLPLPKRDSGTDKTYKDLTGVMAGTCLLVGYQSTKHSSLIESEKQD